MSFPRYPEYKDSGVEWLGEVPVHWALPKIKHVASFSGGATPSRENLEFWNGGIPWVSPKDMKVERIVATEESITESGLSSCATTLLEPGKILMVVRSGILKHTIPVAINDTAVALNQDMRSLDFAPDRCAPLFFLRWVQGLNDELLLAWAKHGATVESIEHEYLANSIIPLPPLPEQTAIAAFLDRETAKIDALVAEQRRLIELLKEKRQAVISHAVTKGLNPDAPMKDSGIEWLGEVPAHWEEYPLRALFSLKHGYAFDGDQFSDSGDYILMTPGSFNEWGGFRSRANEKFFAGSDFPKEFILETGQLLVAMTEQAPGLLGSALFVPDGAVFLHNQRLGLVQNLRSERICARFLYHLFNSTRFRAEVSVSSTGSKVKHTSPQKILSVKVYLPPLEDQREIARHLDHSITNLDTLTAEAQRAIDLLQERRSALISAAVTGQIDVRGFAPAPPAK